MCRLRWLTFLAQPVQLIGDQKGDQRGGQPLLPLVVADAELSTLLKNIDNRMFSIRAKIHC